jgi:hypothetical protein
LDLAAALGLLKHQLKALISRCMEARASQLNSADIYWLERELGRLFSALEHPGKTGPFKHPLHNPVEDSECTTSRAGPRKNNAGYNNLSAYCIDLRLGAGRITVTFNRPESLHSSVPCLRSSTASVSFFPSGEILETGFTAAFSSILGCEQTIRPVLTTFQVVCTLTMTLPHVWYKYQHRSSV